MRNIHKMQGRKEHECPCGDEATKTCASCGGRFCRDCIIDHECVVEEKTTKPALRGKNAPRTD